MGVVDAPGWVLAAWRRSLKGVGATADEATIERYGERLIERWSAPERIHHNLRRLIGVLARVDELAPETHHPDVVRIAAWYHGAVFNAAAQVAYAHRGGVDEAASADLARTELAELGVPAPVVARIAELIVSLSGHQAPPTDIDAQALCDADLGGLAAEPQRYEAYRREVRREYEHIPQRDYVEARLAIVTKLLARPHLFKSPMGHDWEDPARENLSAELARLTHELSTLPPREDVDAPADAERASAEARDAAAGRPTGAVGDAEPTPAPDPDPRGTGGPAAADTRPGAGREDDRLAARTAMPDRSMPSTLGRRDDEAERRRRAARAGEAAADDGDAAGRDPDGSGREPDRSERRPDGSERREDSSLSRPPRMPAVRRVPRDR